MRIAPVLFWILLGPLGFSGLLWAQSEKTFDITRLELHCEGTYCDRISKQLQNVKTGFYSERDIRRLIRNISYNSSIQKLNFWVAESPSGQELHIQVQPKRTLKKIEVKTNVPETLDSIKRSIKYQEGDFFQEDGISSEVMILEKIFLDQGYRSAHFTMTPKGEGEFVDLVVEATLGDQVYITQVEIDSPVFQGKKALELTLKGLEKRPYNIIEVNQKIDEVKQQLVDQGHFFGKVTMTSQKISPVESKILFQVSPGNRYLFKFNGITIFSYQEIKSQLKDLFSKNRKGITKTILQKFIDNLYRAKGQFDTSVSINLQKVTYVKTKLSDIISFVDVNEGHKYRVNLIDFKGNRYFSDRYLREIFRKQGGSLVASGFYDENFAAAYVDILTREYNTKGMLSMKVFGPRIKHLSVRDIEISYQIVEGAQTKVNNLKFPNDQVAELLKDILPELKNQSELPFNPVSLDQDITTMLDYLRSKGHYYAEILNDRSEDLVRYSEDEKSVDLSFNIVPGPETKVSQIIISGNVKTENIVIERELQVKPGQLLVKEDLDKTRENLSNLAIFSDVEITPLKAGDNDSEIDVLVTVKEREAGVFETAPGFRTDIGVKLSTTLSYNNLGGMNRTGNVTAQVNRRINKRTFDSRRQQLDKDETEYALSVGYLEPYFLGTPVYWSNEISNAYRRFYSFDAKITRGTTSFSRFIRDDLNVGVSYQLEAIGQTNATNKNDEGHFRIGSVLPAITWDMRNVRVNPTKGTYFNLSTEFANPYFLSMKDAEREVNYYKVIFRNRTYFPLWDWGALAISLSLGQQENLAKETTTNSSGQTITKGYIPSIKVFRLNGVDIVRGFNDDEINRLEDGQDVYHTTIRDKAFMTNLKVEPRYFLSDSLIMGPFYDAGRVFKDHWTPLKLRSSVGITFKYLTPVGTLDFDYGVKLQRKRFTDGSRERASQFHLQIGFF